MTASFTSRAGGDPVAAFRIDVGAAKPTRGDLLFGGQLQLAAIRDRTLAGIDVDGAPFAPYSAGYAKRKSGALGHGRVDLFGAGHHTHMLNALQVITTDEGFSVGIYSNDELEMRARVHNEGATIRTRLKYGNFEAASYGYKPRNAKRYKNAKASFEMPRRRWLDASEDERTMLKKAIVERIESRQRDRAA